MEMMETRPRTSGQNKRKEKTMNNTKEEIQATIWKRGEGQTTEAVRLAKEKSAYLIVRDRKTAHRLSQQHPELRSPITFLELMDTRMRGSFIKDIVIDDVEYFKYMLFCSITAGLNVTLPIPTSTLKTPMSEHTKEEIQGAIDAVISTLAEWVGQKSLRLEGSCSMLMEINKMTPHDKIKAVLQMIVDTTDFIHPEHENQVVDALELLETHKLVPKYAVVIDDTCGLSKKICTKIATLMLQAGYENAHDYLMETYIRTEIEELISMENNDE